MEVCLEWSRCLGKGEKHEATVCGVLVDRANEFSNTFYKHTHTQTRTPLFIHTMQLDFKNHSKSPSMEKALLFSVRSRRY